MIFSATLISNFELEKTESKVGDYEKTFWLVSGGWILLKHTIAIGHGHFRNIISKCVGKSILS